jgi:hypothetical protein
MKKESPSGDPPIDIQTSSKGLIVNIKGDFAFPSGKADMKPELGKLLDTEIIPRIKASPFQVEVAGHSDSDAMPKKWLKFYKSNVNDCSFFGLNLEEIIIDECSAKNADFREANVSGASFIHSDFSQSLFHNTNLSRADFSEASDYDIDIYENNITKAKFTRYEAVRLLESLDVELID